MVEVDLTLTHKSQDKARKAGLILADVLERGVQGNRPTVLVSETPPSFGKSFLGIWID